MGNRDGWSGLPYFGPLAAKQGEPRPIKQPATRPNQKCRCRVAYPARPASRPEPKREKFSLTR